MLSWRPGTGVNVNMSTRLFFSRFICCVLMISVSACTSLRTYGLDEIDSGLPLEAGDEVTIYLNDENFSESTIIVGKITEKSISGTLVSEPGMQVVIPLDDIARVEVRQFDGVKTGILVSLAAFVLYAAKELDDGLNDVFGD